MYATTIRRRTLVTATALAAAWFVFATAGAVAAPRPETQTGQVNACTVDVHEFTAELRAAGLTAQAANNAARLTYRECRASLPAFR